MRATGWRPFKILKVRFHAVFIENADVIMISPMELFVHFHRRFKNEDLAEAIGLLEKIPDAKDQRNTR